jgi:hypothetical protein
MPQRNVNCGIAGVNHNRCCNLCSEWNSENIQEKSIEWYKTELKSKILKSQTFERKSIKELKTNCFHQTDFKSSIPEYFHLEILGLFKTHFKD